MSVFRFKKFDVVNERSAMKVNTDGVLLGVAMTVTSQDRRLLDIGTGTGTIALMAAQRLTELVGRSSRRSATQDDMEDGPLDEDQHVIAGESQQFPICIDAIDIDEPSATEAAVNFGNSPWSANLNAHNLSLDEYAASLPEDVRFDLIFSNPPYFEDSLTAPDERKSTARHTSEGLSYRDIFAFSSVWLAENGRVALVLPSDQEHDLTRHARMCGFHLQRILRIRTVPRKEPKRIIVEFSRQRTNDSKDEILTIQSEGKYTQEYLSLTRDFYLFA